MSKCARWAGLAEQMFFGVGGTGCERGRIGACVAPGMAACLECSTDAFDEKIDKVKLEMKEVAAPTLFSRMPHSGSRACALSRAPSILFVLILVDSATSDCVSDSFSAGPSLFGVSLAQIPH
eukprot:2027663-Pleurochrysis_carterae.AAC.5